MISEWEKIIYFPMTFNEQMAWIDEEVELILRRKNRNFNADITRINRREGSGHAIDRLFKIIKEDHLLAYVAELESEPTHYFLMRGYDECHDGDEWIGIYDSLAHLKSAYKASAQALEQEHKQYGENDWTAEHKKVMINTFNAVTGEWHYNIPYEVLFPDKNDYSRNEYKAVKIVLDNADMFMFKKEMVKRGRYRDYVCDGTPVRRIIDESISVQFQVNHTYEIFGMMGQWWGDWNNCPDYKTMGNKAQEWQEKYGAELMEMAHDTLIFQCRCLEEDEADALWKDICQIAPNSQDIKGNGKKKIVERGEFALWWD